jgi:hypothetical protein
MRGLLLLHIASRPLKRWIQRLSINKHVARDDTHRSPLSKSIKKRRLSSSRNTHECGHTARFDETRDMIEQSSRLALDLDVIDHISPCKNTLLLFDSADVTSTFLLSLFGITGFFIGRLAAGLHVGGDVATSENELFGGVGGGGVNFDCDEVRDEEEDQETPKLDDVSIWSCDSYNGKPYDAKVAPDMTPGVTVGDLDEPIAVDEGLTSHSTLSIAYKGVASLRVAGP